MEILGYMLGLALASVVTLGPIYVFCKYLDGEYDD